METSYGLMLMTVPVVCLLVTLLGLFVDKGWVRSVKILSSMLFNMDRLHDVCAETLQKSGGTVCINSAFLLNVDMMITADPQNVQHTMNKEFNLYPKGPEWRKRFEDFFGDTMFNTDFEEWKYHREISRAFFSDRRFHTTTFRVVQEVVREGLVPFLEEASEKRMVVDLTDVFQRLAYDIGCEIVGGFKSRSVGVNVARPRYLQAIDDVCETILSRYFRPEFLWSFQRWLGVGQEKKMTEACKVLDQLFQDSFPPDVNASDVPFSTIGCYLAAQDIRDGKIPSSYYQKMKNTFLASVFAVEDNTSITISWFFHVLSIYPDVEKRVKDEVSRILAGRPVWTLDAKELNDMVYLHACLCETLRLFPAVPMEVRVPIKLDILPSGHKVNCKTLLIVSTYAMGRMTSVWGDDCLKFRPERWITGEGRIKHEPSHKFFAFHTGPRICPGKDFSFVVMKMVSAAVLRDFDVKLMRNGPVTYEPSIVLQITHGALMARVSKKSD